MSQAAIALLALTAAIGVGQAQSKTTGALVGTVSSDGQPLPGATVTIASPQLIGGEKNVLTDADGRYRFPEIAPGNYTVTVVAMDHSSVTIQNVVVSASKTRSLPVALKASGTAETIDVSGALPDIDVTSAATTTTLTRDYLEVIPTARFQPDTLNLAPGINEDSAYGGGTASNAYLIDGVDTSDPEGGTAWSFVDYNIIDEVQLIGLGAPAEYGGFTGVAFNSTTKSGSNALKGQANLYFTNSSLVSNNLSKSAAATGLVPSSIEKYWDASVQLGGPIKQDKAWYFLSAQSYGYDSVSGGPLRTERSPRLFAKFNFQPTNATTLEAWLEWDKYDITGRGGDSVTPLEATVTENAPEYVWNFGVKSILTPNTIFNATLQGYTGYYYLDPAMGYSKPGHYDYNTGLYSVNSTYFYLADRDRNNLSASLSHHTDKFLKGSHDFKFGMELERSVSRSRYGYTTGRWLYDNYYSGVDDPGTPEYDPGPVSLAYYGNGYDVHGTNKRASFYAQDNWEVSPNVTLNPGVRVDLNRGAVPHLGNVYKSNPVALRLGVVWDLKGDGKQALRAHYGRYYDRLSTTQYYFVDPGAFQDAYQNLVYPSGYHETFSSPSGAKYSLDPNLKHPYVDQWIAAYDREVYPGITMSLTGISRKTKDMIETVSRDGVFTKVKGFAPVPGTGNSKLGIPVTMYDYSSDPQDDVLLVTNPSVLHRDYKGAILTFTRRLKDNWQALFSYTWSRATGNYDNNLTNSVGPSSFLDTPNSLVNAEGHLTHDNTHQVKLQGSYLFPKIGLQLSGNYTYFTGDAWTPTSRCLLQDIDHDHVPDGGCYSFEVSTRFFAEPRGSRRYPHTSNLDLSLAWRKDLGGDRLTVGMDLLNALNRGIPDLIQTRDGSTLGNPTRWTDPRVVRFWTTFQW